MSILIVDDAEDNRSMLEAVLWSDGHRDILLAGSAREAFAHLRVDEPEPPTLADLILMDIAMPEMDGIEATRRIKALPAYADVPVIVVTGCREAQFLQSAFAAGAMDFITKPIDPVELLSRVRSALGLKRERDLRKQRERELLEMTRQLMEANRLLERLSSLDPLTGLANRRALDDCLEMEWRRARRDGVPLSLLMVDVDHFKSYNDSYGHQAGDACLRSVAGALGAAAHRPGDLAARYGGEEFAVVLSGTDAQGAAAVAEALRARVERLRIPHSGSTTATCVTVSIGIATAISTRDTSVARLLEAADEALYFAKREGRNRARGVDLTGDTDRADGGHEIGKQRRSAS